MTGVAEIFVGLLLAVAVLALVARKLTIPYPILFVVGGLLLGLIPKLPKVRLDPELVFLFVLPPLSYPAALFTSWRDFRASLRPIALLAIGLVLFTTVSVAYLAHYFMDLPLRSEEHTSELQSQSNLVCRLLLEKKKNHISASPSLIIYTRAITYESD